MFSIERCLFIVSCFGFAFALEVEITIITLIPPPNFFSAGTLRNLKLHSGLDYYHSKLVIPDLKGFYFLHIFTSWWHEGLKSYNLTLILIKFLKNL